MLSLFAFNTQIGLKDSPLSKIYIFWTNNRLNIRFGDAENSIQQVRIYNILGQGIYSGSAPDSKYISTPGWAAGIYFCQITTFNNETRTIKFRLE